MSASTGTIQRPMAGGSIFGAVAIGVATLFAVGALAWGAANLTTKHASTTSISVPAYLDRGSRGETIPTGAMPYAAGKVGNVTPRFDAPAAGKIGNVTPRFDTLAPAKVTPVMPWGGWTDGRSRDGSSSFEANPSTPRQIPHR
jgi:hypothetical protein